MKIKKLRAGGTALSAALLLLCLAAAGPAPVRADEGLWLFNKFPAELVRARYGFAVTPEWLRHFRLACVNMGGSASFVSPDGLVVTNHHVGAGAIQALGTPQRDLMKTGFYAKARAEELRCPGLEVSVLVDIEDVTARVQAAEKPGMSAAEAARARESVVASLEASASGAGGRRGRVVTLYAGGLYHLYTYKFFDDVRLVFAPEQSITFFGGDPDNYGYPRYCLDVAFFRIYENGAPYRTPDHLKWNTAGLKEGELVFAAGNPITTSRLLTMAQLEFLRDVSYPFIIDKYLRQRDGFRKFSAGGAEPARAAFRDLWGAENEIKCFQGQMTGLTDAALMAAKRRNETELRSSVRKDPALAARYGAAWDEIAAAEKEYAAFYREHQFFAGAQAFDTIYFYTARAVVRAAAAGKTADFETIRKRYYSRPTSDAFEEASLAVSLAWLAAALPDAPETRRILDGRTPERAAADLVGGTALRDPEAARRLLESGAAGIAASKDPMVRLAAMIEPAAQELGRRYRDRVQALEVRGGAEIAKVLFELKGTSVPPDGTETLRLSFGAVKSYEEDGRLVPYQTTYRGLYERSDANKNVFPFDLPKSFLDARGKVDLDAPLNFVATCDSSGGNSGSPLVNKDGEFCGILFDGNKQSLPARFLYSDTQCRSVMVHAGGILEALRSVYGAGGLVDELLAGRK